MVKLTNRAVQENLYEILNLTGDPHIWTHGNYKNEHKLVTKTSDTATMSYPYDSREALQADYEEIMRLKELLQ